MMKTKSTYKPKYSTLLAPLILTVCGHHAITATLSDRPLETTSQGGAKPNLMFIMDTSGSMARDYTPDWIVDGSRNYCKSNNSGNYQNCGSGMPPFMSADFNSQYYNPNVTYTPPKDALGNTLMSMNKANTNSWQSVKVDGYNMQGYRNYGGNSSINLTNSFHDLQWCNGVSCIKNSGDNNTNTSDYTYPDNSYVSKQDTTGAPYYYTISANRYCTDINGTNCISSNTPTATHTVKLPYLWCNSSNIPSAACRAQRDDTTYKYVSFYSDSAEVLANQATRSMQFTALGSATIPTTTTITSVKFNDNDGTNDPVELLPNSISVTCLDGANCSGGLSKRAYLASQLATKIADPGFCNITATASSDTVTFKSNAPNTGKLTQCNGTITITISDANNAVRRFATNQSTVATAPGAVNLSSTTSGGSNSTPAKISFYITAAGDPSLSATTSITSIKIGSTNILNGTATSGAASVDSVTKWRALANSICSKIYNGWSGSCSDTVVGSNTYRLVTLTATANGSGNNGKTVSLTYADSLNISTALTSNIGFSFSLTGGTNYIPATISSIFNRVDITSANAVNFPNKPSSRTDCAGTKCTYDEEMTNFANWFTYYRTRVQTMKSAASLAFNKLTGSFRVGFIDLWGNQFLPVTDFSGTNRSNWYSKLFSQSTGSGTPLREALSRVGRYYAGKTDGINATAAMGTPAHPVQYSCQQNFALLTTDGYWNGGGGKKIDNTDLTGSYDTLLKSDPDATETAGTNFARPIFDGNVNSNGTLADVAAYYYYHQDLVGDTQPNGEDNVPTTDNDPAKWQHMTTFTLGLGVDGRLRYTKDYKSNVNTDFGLLKGGVAGSCPWDANCNWPTPTADTDTAVDDLWHAAVNGHGTYFSAKQPNEVVTGLVDALSQIQQEEAASAAAATSTPVVTQSDNQLFVSKYVTVRWHGLLQSRKIDTASKSVSTTPDWEAETVLESRDFSSRTLYTRSNTGSLIPFNYSDLDATAKGWFSNKGSQLSQYPEFNATDKALLDDGQRLVDYLRGKKTDEGTLYRDRTYILGDAVNAAPVYVRVPARDYQDAVSPSYKDFKEGNTARIGVVYLATNDGFIHAFKGETGDELWAYAPRITLNGLYQLASNDYKNNHRYFVDGTPTVEDIYDPVTSKWRTILVGGLNKGGRGFYALDITDPSLPKPLWEICSDATICSIANTGMGYSFGNPIITKRPTDGKWVVYLSSGYLDGTPLQGKLFEVDAVSGTLLRTFSTTTGDGLARISGWVENYTVNNTSTDIYGADLSGNVWRFDLTAGTTTKIADLNDGSNDQPVTTRLMLTKCKGKRFILAGTGKFLDAPDISDKPLNSLYGFVDGIPASDANRQNLRSSNKVVKQTATYGQTGISISKNLVDLGSHDGWMLDLQSNSGERVNIDPILVAGNFNVITNIPTATANACEYGGRSRRYQLKYCSGAPLEFVSDTGETLSAVTEKNVLIVGSTLIYTKAEGQDGVSIVTLTVDKTGAVALENTGSDLGSSMRAPRTSWRELVQ